MNKKLKQNYELLAQAAGLRLDEENGVLYGQCNGFSLVAYASNTNAPYQLCVNIAARREQPPLTKKECRRFVKENKPVMALLLKGYLFSMTVKGVQNQVKFRERFVEALKTFTGFLQASGYRNCCQACGKTEATEGCCIGNNYMLLCEGCFVSMSQDTALKVQQKMFKKENVIGGIVGALIGSLLGVACIVILSQMGYVAALSGIVMAVCTFKGYELLGARISRKSIVICVLIMLFMTYFGNRLDWALLAIRELDLDFAAAYQIIPVLLEEGVIESFSYWGNLILVYLFLLFGAIPTVRNIIKNQGREGRVCRLAAPDNAVMTE